MYSFEIWKPVVQTDFFFILNEKEKQILNEKEKRDGGERKVRNNDDEDIGEDLCELNWLIMEQDDLQKDPSVASEFVHAFLTPAMFTRCPLSTIVDSEKTLDIDNPKPIRMHGRYILLNIGPSVIWLIVSQ